MGAVVLIDTNVLIDVERDVERAIACVESLENQAQLAISVITEMEMIVGCRDKKELRILQHFLQRFEVYPLTPPIAQIALDLLKQYNLSHGLLIADALIAATALTFQIPLVSGNQRDFQCIEGLEQISYP
jgi:hypothetical protein